MNRNKIQEFLNKAINKFLIPFKKLYIHASRSEFKLGSPYWLINKEIQYGGKISNVPRHKVSILDPRAPEEIKKGGMIGGDRMLHHGYAAKYSEYLGTFLGLKRKLVIVEIGILKGSGLAMWCDLFPKSRIIGLDIDLDHFLNNKEKLVRNGAFRQNSPEIHQFDQFLDNKEYLAAILKGEKIDICIDDGFHSDDSILKTLSSAYPHLAENFAYFIEDNSSVNIHLKKLYSDLKTDYCENLTVLTRQAK